VLARSKLDSINTKVSRALDDGKIDHSEFQDIQGEKMKFFLLVEKIQKFQLQKSNPNINPQEIELAETRALLQSKLEEMPLIGTDSDDARIFDIVKKVAREISTPQQSYVPSAPIRHV
jgi:hypothetical protein